MSFLAGFAEAGSEYIREQRKQQARNNEIIVQGVLDSIPELKERKSKRRKMRDVAKIFKDTYNLSNDQIGSILRSGKADETLAQMRKLDSLSPELREKIGYDSSNVVKFHDGYEESGLTLDQHIDAVMGKLNTGMSFSDAVQDIGGKPATGFAALFQPKNKIAKGRMAALEAAYGKDTLSQALAVRQGNITYGDDFRTGAVSLPDPITEAAVKKAMEPKTTGMTSAETTRDALFDFGGDVIGGKTTGYTQAGRPVYEFEKPGRRAALQQKVTSIVAEKEKEVGRSTFSAKDREDMQSKLNAWATETYGPKVDPKITEAASKVDAIKTRLRSNTSWVDNRQARTRAAQELAVELVKAGQATDDDALSAAYKIIFDEEKLIKQKEAAAKTAAPSAASETISSDMGDI